jgi:hypothetical protein
VIRKFSAHKKGRAGSGGRGESEIIPALQNAVVNIYQVAPKVNTCFEKKCSYLIKIIYAEEQNEAFCKDKCHC